MALIKQQSNTPCDVPAFDSLDDCIECYQKSSEIDDKITAIECSVNFNGSDEFLIELLQNEQTEPVIATRIGALLASKPAEIAPIEAILSLLSLENAHVRNTAITVLRSYGEAIRYYIVKYLIGDDKDLRIFAINILGDVNFKESREMLLELLEKEQDLNAAMTAVDYLAEIGEPEDIELLESLKLRFNNDGYVTFAVDNAIRSIKG